LKEKLGKRSKQTCSLIACATLMVLSTLLFMVFDIHIENLKAREDGLRQNPWERVMDDEKILGFLLARAENADEISSLIGDIL
jgi:hypothetical protein